MTIFGSQSSPPSWGLTRVSQRGLQLSEPYVYNNAAGEGVTAYVVDTGVYVEHFEFGGRATWGANFVEGTSDADEHGHGTHVAGTIGGAHYGVAKKVNIVAVRVLDAQGSGSLSGVIAGMDWVAKNAVAGKSVVNMSLGGSKSQAINDAAGRLFAANIPLIAAADLTVPKNTSTVAGTAEGGNVGIDALADSQAGDGKLFLDQQGVVLQMYGVAKNVAGTLIVVSRWTPWLPCEGTGNAAWRDVDGYFGLILSA
ncbi:hypothetical protein BGZ74_005086 [Mortierella antarctica]|nr:hypothetical protein BGZ74_005086 [Mortierella antarctica]